MRCVTPDARAIRVCPAPAFYPDRISGIHRYAARVITQRLTGYQMA